MTSIHSSAKKSKPWWRWGKEPELTNKQSEEFFRASQWQLVWWKFRRHQLARVAMIVLAILYFSAFFAEFLTPYDPLHRFKEYVTMPPVKVHIIDSTGQLRLPFIYGITRARDPVTLRPIFTEDVSTIFPIYLFVHGDPYEFLGIRTDLHLFGVVEQDGKTSALFLLGSDTLGRDVFSRVIYGGRISLTVGLIGVFLAFVFGLLFGGLAGFFGGLTDELIMRTIDVLVSIPQIPLWMALAAALPQNWPSTKTYFFVTIILSILGWTTLARTVRGKMLSIREEDFIMAARLDCEQEMGIITRYMLPGFASYIIVALTLAIPNMILGETALSFLGLGLRAPAISWGVMLQDAQNLQTVSMYPWLLWPCAFVVLAVLMFNFLGDGMRDAADPYVS
jgi:peptide/nickel transport system permease protein